MKAEVPSLRIPFRFVLLLFLLLLTSLPALANVQVQFVPTSGTAPLMGGLWKKLSFPGTVAAVTGTFTGVDTTVSSTGTLSVTVSGGTSSSANTQAQYTRTQSAVTVNGSGGFTEGPLYQSYGGYNASGGASLWLSLSKVQASTWFLVELYAYDNSNSGGMIFTDMTSGSAATSGSVTYSGSSTFTTNSDADNRYSVILAVQSDANGKIVIKGSAYNGNANAILNGFQISSKWIPRVYVPTLSPTERVVASVTPQQFGAKGDGVTDDTAAFQNAMNFVYHMGTRAGGVVYVPNATYAFNGNLSVPQGVTLHGDWKNWTSGTSGAVGTTFAVYTTGSATGTPFMTLVGNNALKGINFWYPNQDPSSVTPTPYPFTLKGSNPTLEGLVLINSFQGVNFVGNNYNPRGVYGTPLSIGIQVDGGADWASMADINFSPEIWAASKLPNAPATANGPYASWMLNNGTGLLLMRIDGLNCIQTNFSGYNIAINLSRSSGAGTTGVPMPSFYSGTIQNCKTGVAADNMPSQQGLQMTNFTISAGTAMTNVTGGFFIHLENCTLTGTSGTAVRLSNTSANAWNMFFQAQDCTFNGTIVQNCGVADIVNSTLNAATQCNFGANLCKAAFAGCTFSPSKNIVNNAASSALLISSSGATLAASPVITPGLDWNELFTAYQACQPAKQDLFVATDYGAVGDGDSDDTSAIQAALSAAAGNGGGIVYLPGGHYKTSSSLTVPNGVELRGVHELRHSAGPWTDGFCKASVLHPTGGSGSTSGPPAVILSSTSGIRGVDFVYESQTPVAPIAYPPSIQGRGSNVYAIAASLPNTYIGIDFDTYSCPNHYISLINGVPLDTFIRIGNGSSGYVVDTEAQSTFWVYLDDSNCTPNYRNGALNWAIGEWTLANSTVHRWGDCNEKVALNPSINNNIAVHCVSENGRGPTIVGVVQTCDVSNYGFYLEGPGPSNISLANSWIVIRSGVPILSTSSYQGTFRLFNAAIINGSTAPMDYSIAGGDVGVQMSYIQLYSTAGAQVTGGVFHLINQCTYIGRTTNGDAFPTYPLNFSGPGQAGNPSRAVGNYSYKGYAITSYPGSVTSEWGNFSRYTTPAIPRMPDWTPLVATGRVGSLFNYLIPASNGPITAFTATPLPTGLSVNKTTGMISGTPSAIGCTSVALSATNSAGSGTGALTILIVPQPPAITSVLSATGTQCNAFSYQIAGTNVPNAFTATGLPPGLSLDPDTGIISGTPGVTDSEVADATGTWNVQITAANDGGTSPAATLILVIQPAPLSITSNLSVTGTDRSSFSYQITANNSPTSYNAVNLPAGLSINQSTGLISGSPTTTGTFSVMISAINASGTEIEMLTINLALAAPLISSALSATGTNGVAFSHQIQATDSPTGYSASNLPTGLSVSATSGLITGTPTVTGTKTATIIASNAVGSGTASLVITILPPGPPAPANLTAVSSSGQVSLSWKASTGATSYNLKRSLSSGSGYAIMTSVTGTNYVDAGVTNGTLYYYLVSAVGSTGLEGVNSNQIGIMPGILPNPWLWQNISASNIGGANLSGTTFSLAACGGDIWYSSDSFGSIFQAGGTTCKIVARVVDMVNTASGAKAGIMMRESLTANSPFVGVVLSSPIDIMSISRTGTGKNIVQDFDNHGGGSVAPYWLKLVRSGTNFTSYISPNGTSWTLQKIVSVNMASSMYVGMAVASHNTAAICTAHFDNVSVSGTLPTPPQLSNYQTPVVVQFGELINYQITANNSPAYYTATGLPTGLSVSASGKISGVPSALGTSVITISAGNDGGVDTENLTIGVVSQPPTITSLSATGTNGKAFSFQIAATNTPTIYGASGLPEGFVFDSSMGLITGTPTLTGTFNASISATNPLGTGSATLAITILPAPPEITSATAVTGTNGSAFSYQITASGGATSYAATGLPDGLAVDTSSGLISGMPTLTGTFSAAISAGNITGSGSATLVMNILPPPPAITSAASATGTNGKAFRYQITANGGPTSFGADGLPAGLKVDPGTGLITGTPTISGTFKPSIIGINGSGPGSATLTITLATGGLVNTWTWDPLTMGNGSDGSGTWDNLTALFSSGTTDVAYAPGIASKTSGTVTVGSNTIKVTSATGVEEGEALSLSNFAAGTLVSLVSGTTITLTGTATSGIATNTSLTFVDANDVSFGNGSDPAGTVLVSGTQYAGSMTINPAGSGNYVFNNGAILLGTRYGSTGILTLNDSATINSVINFRGVSFAAAGETLTLNGGSGTLGYNNGVITGTSPAISLASSLLLSSGTYTLGGVVMWNIGDMTNGTGGITIQPGATLNQNYNIFVGYFSTNPGLVKLNGGIWNILAGSSLVLGRTYSGGTIIQSGTLNSQGIITVGMNSEGMMKVNGGCLTSSTTMAINSGNGNGTLNINGGTTTLATINFGGGGYGGTSTSGSGTLSLTGGSLFVGNGGIVKTGSGTSACVISLSGGTLAASADWISVLPMALANTVVVQAADEANAPRNINLSGILSGAGGLFKSGLGTLALSGSSTYSGGTVVGSGTLMVNNTVGSGAGTGPVTVSNGATLAGTGAIGAAVTVNGQLSPGLNSTGTMTINGNLALNNGGSWKFGVGTASGLVKVFGNLTLGGTLNCFNSGGLTTGTYRLITYSGSLTNTGLALGSVPAFPFTFQVNTSVPGQVDLIVSLAPMDSWKATMFGANATNPAVSGDAVINNSAQIPNLMAYGLGLNPNLAQAADLPTPALKQSGSNQYLSLKFHRNTAATDISFIVESGSSLSPLSIWLPVSTFMGGSWSPAGQVFESGTGPQLNVEVIDTVPTRSSPKRFIRLKAIH